MADLCFCHLNGYKVKDADARASIEALELNKVDNTTLATTKAEIDGKIATVEADMSGLETRFDNLHIPTNANEIGFDNIGLGITATNVQGAIEEVKGLASQVAQGTALGTTYGNAASGLVATNVQDAIDELSKKTSDLKTDFGGFKFTTQNDKDGYLKDGEFYPFGNPYLRHNEDTGYIQALNDNGEWVNMAACPVLPISELNINTLNELMFETYAESGTTTTSFTANPLEINTRKTSDSVSAAGVRTKDYYDLSSYSKLKFSYNARSYIARIWLFDESGNTTIVYEDREYTPTAFHVKTGEIDLSSYNGKYKVGIGCGMYYADSNYACTIKTDEFLLCI